MTSLLALEIMHGTLSIQGMVGVVRDCLQRLILLRLHGAAICYASSRRGDKHFNEHVQRAPKLTSDSLSLMLPIP